MKIMLINYYRIVKDDIEAIAHQLKLWLNIREWINMHKHQHQNIHLNRPIHVAILTVSDERL